jgi:hypothetical protein
MGGEVLKGGRSKRLPGRPRSRRHRQEFVGSLHRQVFVPVEQRLTDGIALVVVTGAWKGEEFGLKIRQPIRSLRQKNLARLEFRRGDRHPAHLIPDRLYGDDSRDLLPQLLNERGSGDSIFDKNASRGPLLGEALYRRLERRIIDPPPPDVEQIPTLFAGQDPGRANRPVVVRAAFAGGVSTLHCHAPLSLWREYVGVTPDPMALNHHPTRRDWRL